MKISQLKSYFPRIFIVVSLLSAAPALALDVDAPEHADGNYTVTFSGCLNLPTTVYCRLEERVGTQGAWTNVPASSGSAVFTNKPEGEYFYRAHEFTFYEVIVGGEPTPIFEHFYSAEARVIVHDGPIPVPGSIEEQLHYTYETRVGDLNGDSLSDILVKRTSGGEAQDGSIDAVILQAIAGGIFTEIVPSAAQLLEAESWQEVAIAIILDDLNADGFLDVFLKDLSSTITGALDQMIYAPGEIFPSGPKGIKAVDTNLVDFVEDAFGLYVDDDYFEDNAVVVDDGYWHQTWECIWVYNYIEHFWDIECELVFEWVEVFVTEYPGMNSDAIDIWNAIEDYENGQGDYQAVLTLFQSILDVEVGNDSDCDELILNIPEVEDEEDCKALSISAALAAVRRSLEAYGGPFKPFGRETDTVYVTAHRFFGIRYLPFHTAIEYRDPISYEYTTISAECDTTECAFTGLLVSDLGRDTDEPQHNLTLGAVTSAEAPSVYFLKLLLHNSYYRDCLDYDAIPDGLPGTGYNSNSYTAGIILATGGLSEYDLTLITGGETPVPSIYFDEFAPACP